jgi:hypothetical protein
MALTIYQEPQAYTPAYNEQTILALSNQIAVADFKYVVTVRVNGGTLFTYNILQRPDGYLVFDAMEVVKNYINRDYFDPLGTYIGLATGKSAAVIVTVKEYYSGAIHGTYAVTYVAYDACLDTDTFRNFVYSNYISDSSGAKLLSFSADEFNIPESKVDIKNDVWIHFFNYNYDKIDINVYDSASVLLGGFSIMLTPDTNMWYANIGYTTLQRFGYTPQDGYTIEIDFITGTTSYLSTSLTFYDLCTKYKKYSIQYLKRNGNINVFNFEFLSQETITKKVNNVRLNPKRLMVGPSYGSNSWDREVNTVSTLTTKQITLNTNWISEFQSAQLTELFDSPIIWLVIDGEYKPVSITDTSYEIKNNFTDPLYNYKIVCEYDIQETRQRGI